MTRSWVENVSNLLHLDGLDSDDALTILQGRPMNLSLLRPFLHECTHHQCFSLPVGSAMALLDLRSILLASQTPQGADGRQVALAAARSQVARELFRPLAEGIAHFYEFDAWPRGARSVSSTFGRAAFLFVPPGTAKGSDPFSDLLLHIGNVRSAPTEVRRKADLCLQPLSATESPNLIGYLFVKSLWALSSAGESEVDLHVASDLFASFLVHYFFSDPETVALLLGPTDDLDLPRWTGELSEHIRNRAAGLPLAVVERASIFDQWCEDGAEIHQLSMDDIESILGLTSSRPVPDGFAWATVDVFQGVGMDGFTTFVQEAMQGRSLLRLARVDGEIECRENGVAVFIDDPLAEPLMVTTSDFHSGSVGRTKGTFEICFDTKAGVIPELFFLMRDESGVVGAKYIYEWPDQPDDGVPPTGLWNLQTLADVSRQMLRGLGPLSDPLFAAVAPLVEAGIERTYLDAVAAFMGDDPGPVWCTVPEPMMSTLGSTRHVRGWALFGMASGWLTSQDDLVKVFEHNDLSYPDFLDVVLRSLPQPFVPNVMQMPSGRMITFP